MIEFFTEYKDVIVTFFLTAGLTLLLSQSKKLFNFIKFLTTLREQNDEFKRLFYKQALWSFYYEFMDGNKYIPPERYAFAKKQYDEYVKLEGNGTTQFTFERIEQIYKKQQENKKKNDLFIYKSFFLLYNAIVN